MARVLVLAILLVTASAAAAGAAFVDAVLAQVGSAIVSASDITLARALGLFGFTPSDAPIDATDVDRYATALAETLEASRLGLGPSPAEIDQAWAALEERRGGATATRAWLDTTAIGVEWARRALEAHLRWRAWAEFHEGFPDEASSPSKPDAAPVTKPQLGTEAKVTRLLGPAQTVPVPFPMPR
jgi:hypothetical protein